MLLNANGARSVLTASVTSAAGQVASITTATGTRFVGFSGLATSTANPMRCVMTAVDANGNDTGAFEIVEVTRSGDSLTLVRRGLEGTTAAAWGVGTVIENRPTAGLVDWAGNRLIARGIGRTGIVATADTSLLPGGTAISIPAGSLEVGDVLVVECVFGHVGGTTTAQNYDVIWNSFYGTFAHANSSSYAGLLATAKLAIRTLSAQTSVSFSVAGGSYNAATSQVAFNLANPVTVDIVGRFAVAPAGGETLGLDHYSVRIEKGLP